MDRGGTDVQNISKKVGVLERWLSGEDLTEDLVQFRLTYTDSLSSRGSKALC